MDHGAVKGGVQNPLLDSLSQSEHRRNARNGPRSGARVKIHKSITFDSNSTYEIIFKNACFIILKNI